MFLCSFIFLQKIFKKIFLYKLLIINVFEFLLQKTFKKNFTKHLVSIKKARTFALANQK